MVSIYYLTQTILSSTWIYTVGSFDTNYNVTRPSAPMAYSAFKYNVAHWPKAYIEKVGNLTYYEGKLAFFIHHSWVLIMVCDVIKSMTLVVTSLVWTTLRLWWRTYAPSPSTSSRKVVEMDAHTHGFSSC